MIKSCRRAQQRRWTGAGTRGFSLLELMVVMVIAAVVGTVALPRIDSSRYRADSVVQNVRSALQVAQRNALVRQHDVILNFDTIGNRIRIGMDGNNDQLLTTGELIQVRELQSGNQFKRPPANGISGSVATSIVGAGLRTMDGMPTVTFHRDGSLSSDLEIYIRVPGKTTAYVYRAVSVIQSTSRSDWYRWSVESNAWRSGAL
jgi:prepilin-type N-terminal cleavage/methylation domain-containing protein